jgi:hypothetical protein
VTSAIFAREAVSIGGTDILIVRRHDGALGCFIRVPVDHELYGETDLRVLSLALETPGGITYSAGGALGWFVGFRALCGRTAALRTCEALARQLAGFVRSGRPVSSPGFYSVSGAA